MVFQVCKMFFIYVCVSVSVYMHVCVCVHACVCLHGRHIVLYLSV